MNFKLWLETNLDQRIERWKGFRSTADVPSPAFVTKNPEDDALAVLAGTKPSAILHISHVSPEVEARIKQTPNMSSITVGELFIFGQPVAVSQLYGLMRNTNKLPRTSDGTYSDLNFHSQVGKYLGYAPEAIAKYTKKLQTKYGI